MNSESPTPDEFQPIEERLRSARAVPDGAELDSVHQRATAGASRSRRGAAGRLAAVSLVAGALLVGGSSASLAVTGLSGSGSAGSAQYRQPTTSTGTDTPQTPSSTPPTTTSDNSPQNPSSTTPTDTTENLIPPASDRVPERTTGDPTQTTRQLASETGAKKLPFTGLSILPILAAGLLLLAGGFLLRRRSGLGTTAT